MGSTGDVGGRRERCDVMDGLFDVGVELGTFGLGRPHAIVDLFRKTRGIKRQIVFGNHRKGDGVLQDCLKKRLLDFVVFKEGLEAFDRLAETVREWCCCCFLLDRNRREGKNCRATVDETNESSDSFTASRHLECELVSSFDRDCCFSVCQGVSCEKL